MPAIAVKFCPVKVTAVPGCPETGTTVIAVVPVTLRPAVGGNELEPVVAVKFGSAALTAYRATARVGTMNDPVKVPSACVNICVGSTAGVVPTETVTARPACLEKPRPVIVTTAPEGADAEAAPLMSIEAPTVNVADAVLGAGKDWSAALIL